MDLGCRNGRVGFKAWGLELGIAAYLRLAIPPKHSHRVERGSIAPHYILYN